MKIAVIGCGNLGSAFVRSFLKEKTAAPNELVIVENDADQRERLHAEFPVRVIETPDEGVRTSDLVVLAVKPQAWAGVSAVLSPYISSDQVLLSVMTGIKIGAISEAFGNHQEVARSMPNLPVQIGKGVTGFVLHPQFSKERRSTVTGALDATGISIELAQEELLDGVTAVSGSGPGFIFEFLSHCMDETISFGFSKEQARQLIAETVKGSVDLWLQSGRDPVDLRDSVASKGGTTEAGLKVLSECGVGKVLRKSLHASRERAIELGGKKT